jgi:hypothetical protein
MFCLFSMSGIVKIYFTTLSSHEGLLSKIYFLSNFYFSIHTVMKMYVNRKNYKEIVKFEVFTAVTMKNSVL